MPLKEVMQWVIDPAADVIWESVAIIITEKGEEHREPKTDAQWDAVRNAAATMIESSNLLLLPGRARDDKHWTEAVTRMAQAAGTSLKAAQAKDATALFDSGTTVYNACSACHARYRVGEAGAAPAPAPAPAKTAK
jgi:cytochrome c553